MKKGLKLGIFTIIIVLTLLTPMYLFITFRSIDSVKIVIDFNSTLGVDMEVEPVYNTLNIWDIDWFLDPNNKYENYIAKQYFIDNLVIMTATGGRNTFSNEYLNISESGEVSYDFSKLEIMIDWLKNASITPIFVIGNTPYNLTQDKNNIDYGAFGADISEPNNYTIYYNYIVVLTQHLANYGGLEFINNWTWRIYTEPDNSDWLLDELDAYFQIYNTSACAIRSVLPNAKIALGNMMDKKLDDRFKNFINRLHYEIPEVFPNQIGWSVYGFGNKDLFMRDAFSDINDWRIYLNKLGRENIEFVIEEGQILADENGIRLWGGDSTELGGAFTANAFKSCIYDNISRYTTWSFYSSELRTPKLNVIDMFIKMKGEKLVNFNIQYDFFTLTEKKTIDGIAAIAEDSSKAHILLYNLVRNRNLDKNIEVEIEILNLPEELTIKNRYVIDKNHSNFHEEWDIYSKDFTYITNPSYNDGSIYDVSLGTVLAEEYKSDYYVWSWNNRDKFGLEMISSDSINSNTDNLMKESMNTNTIILLEFE